MGLAASQTGCDAEHKQQFCFPPRPWPSSACTGPLHGGFGTFPTCSEVSKAAAAFLAGLTVLLSSSGQGCHCCTAHCSVRCSWALPGLCGGFFFFPSMPLNTPEGWITSPAKTERVRFALFGEEKAGETLRSLPVPEGTYRRAREGLFTRS